MCMQDLGLGVLRQECRGTDGIYGTVIKQKVLADTRTGSSCVCRASIKARKLYEAARPPGQIGRQKATGIMHTKDLTS